MLIADPDCAAGKHTNCHGGGWDVDLDEFCACPCPCHFAARLGINTEIDEKGDSHV